MIEQAHSPIYWTRFTLDNWSMYIAATLDGLCYVGTHNQPLDELTNWATSRFQGYKLVEDSDRLAPYSEELSEYLQGTRKEFTIPFDFRGTPFQLVVWNALCRIPYGQTRSYSDIAVEIQKPTAVRAVGTAIGANPILITIPCHRVIGKNGALTGYRGGMDMKKRLLQLEQNGGED
jgi:methylated-DNA-[protein]-cysteine S-methyltransferase